MAPRTATGAEEIPSSFGGGNWKLTAQDIANLSPGGSPDAEDVAVDDSLFVILSGADVQAVFDNLDAYLNAFPIPGLDDVLAEDNEANGASIVELAAINNSINDFDLLVSNGNVVFNFGNAPSGVFGLDAYADQIQFTADQWFAVSSDNNMLMFMDIDLGYMEFQNQSNFLRITDFDIELGAPLLGYLNASDTNTLLLNSNNAFIYKKDKILFRTTAALPANTVGGSNTTLTGNVNGPIPSATSDGSAMTLNQAILVCDEANQQNNGAYSLTQVGVAGGGGSPYILTRLPNSNSGSELECAVYNVERGTRFAGTSWKQVTPQVTLGSSNIVFKPFGDNIIEDSVSGYYRIVSTAGVLSTTAV